MKSIIFSGYGNELVRRCKLYMDTVLQIALQLAFFKTHDRWVRVVLERNKLPKLFSAITSYKNNGLKADRPKADRASVIELS